LTGRAIGRLGFLAAVLLTALQGHVVRATNHELIIKMIAAGRNGDASVQFVQMEVSDCSQTAWGAGPFDGTTESRAMLRFFDASDIEVGQLKLPNAPCTNSNGFNNKPVLIGSPAFQAAADLPEPDITLPFPFIVPTSGKVCFKNNPANGNAFFVTHCVSYGSFAGNTEGQGLPTAALPISGFQALRSSGSGTQGFGFGVTNSTFSLQAANPTNSSGDTVPGPPSVTSFNPTTGSAGASVNISGSNFNGATAVTFNGTAVTSFTVNSNTLITSTVPTGATTGPIAVTTPLGTGISSTNFTVVVAPPNDNFANRLPLNGLSVPATGTNVNATTEAGEPNHDFFTPSKTVWWTWTAPGSGSVTIDTLTSSFDTVLAVYTGSAVNALTRIASNDQFGGTSQSSVTFSAAGGTVFQIVVGGFFGSQGNIALHLLLTLAPPTVSGFNPASGFVGTGVTIDGTNFTGATAVRSNGISASFTVNSNTSITATVPNGATTGPISVQTPIGTATSASNFTVSQAARTFVSVAGNDANNCANVATPCRTLDAGITQVSAGGEVIVLRTGPYGGATITKSVKLNVPTGVIAFTASSFTINAGMSDVVVLRGLTIKALTAGTGTGVAFNSGAALYVENTVLDGWSKGIEILGPGQLFVTDSTVRNSTAAGLRVAPASGTALVSVDRSRFEGTSGGCGVETQPGGEAAVRNSVLSGNQHGLCVTGTGSIDVQKSQAANNAGSGLRVTGGGAGRVRGSVFTDNAIGLENVSSILESLGDNLVQGNGADTSGTITVVSGK
jgi:hypothetical protein